jgi:hypothetical protein
MRRSFWHRALAALMAGWLAIVMAEPAVLHACPMHGGAHAAAQGGEGSAMAMHGVAGHSSDAPPPARGHQCTCLGQCCAPVGVAAPAALVALGPALERAAARDAGLPDFEYVPVAAAHVLPFPNGPPSSVA